MQLLFMELYLWNNIYNETENVLVSPISFPILLLKDYQSAYINRRNISQRVKLLTKINIAYFPHV